jgi:hypothetical protein
MAASTELEDKVIGKIVRGICDGAYRTIYEDIKITFRRPPKKIPVLLSAFAKQLEEAPNKEDLLAFARFTPVVFAELRDRIWQHSRPVPSCLLSREAARDLFEIKDWLRWYSATLVHSEVTQGRIGRLADVNILVDFLPDPILKNGEVYFLTAPKILWREDGTINPLGVAKGIRLK